MDRYYFFPTLKKGSGSYNEKYDKFKNMNNANMSESINIGNPFSSQRYSYLSEIDILDNSNAQIKYPTHYLNNVKNKNKLIRESNQYTDFSCNTNSSTVYDTNLYGNNFMLNNRCSYIKARYLKGNNYNINNIPEEQENDTNPFTINLGNFNNNHAKKNDNNTKEIDTCIMFKKNYPNNSLKINKNMNNDVLEECISYTQPNTLPSCKFDNKSDIIKMREYKNNYIYTYDNKNSKSSIETSRYYDDIEADMTCKTFDEEMQSLEENYNSLSFYSQKYNEEVSGNESIYFKNSMSQLIKRELSSCKENNIFIKFIMSEININIKIYKLIIILIVLILLSLSKNIQNYAVVTRKCYNIYESPLKSTKRLLKYMIIILKILYKCSFPIFSYILSFIFVTIIRTFIILNIPIFIFILYWKIVLKNEEPHLKFYFQTYFNIYMYIIMQVAPIFKNCSKKKLLSDLLFLSYRLYQFIFIYVCRFFIKFYKDIFAFYSV
ncbi:conserved Plasmodium protein, unknown function [Plasmodium chabaudi adami]|uniref:Uncharacterized protein n=1 Tax=Plasmodium chabaudi adami TaxID=5826 RepID=A0A1D3LG73_PLACE|nr:conserved Plasmodium protein, unknown function [Plasmodium chabaudi adami]